MKEFKDSTSAVVGDVDCTVHEKLCSTHGVDGYPTIKWGKIGDLKDYNGEREIDDLRKFAKENLGPVCGPKSLDDCDETQKKQVQEAMALTTTDLMAKLQGWKDEIEELEKVRKEKVDAIKKGGLTSFQAVWDDRFPPPPPPPAEEEEENEGGDDMDGDMGDETDPQDDGKDDL